MKALCIALAMLLLTACTHNRWRAEEARAHYAAQSAAIEKRTPLFELRAAEGHVIELRGVSALIVHDPREQRIEALPQPEHPAWGVARSLLPAVVTGLVGIHQARYMRDTAREQYDWLGRVVESAQPSVTVGRDYITGSQHIGDAVGRDLISGHVGDAIGRDRIGRDQVHVGRDQITGDRNHNRGRQDSPGPIESGDCRDGADCSTQPPPPPPPDPDPEG
jgi:hypothetical protein